MQKIRSNNYFVLTGAMGAGKSTLLAELRGLGIKCIDEPAREILAKQRASQGDGVPEINPQKFTHLLLAAASEQYAQMREHDGVVVFDRGIPDNIAYAALFNLDTATATTASENNAYNKHVFFLGGWEAIYRNDDERKMTFDEANTFGQAVRKIYEKLGYELIDVPLGSPSMRAAFITGIIEKKEN